MTDPQRPWADGDATEETYSLENVRHQAREARMADELESSARQRYWRRQRKLNQAVARDVRTILTPPARYFRADYTPYISALFLSMLAAGIAWLLPALSPGAVLIAFVVGGICGYIGHLAISSVPAVRDIPYMLLFEYGIKRFNGLDTLVGGWTGLTENGNDRQAVEDLPTLFVPVRTDEIATDLTHTRAALEAMRAE